MWKAANLSTEELHTLHISRPHASHLLARCTCVIFILQCVTGPLRTTLFGNVLQLVVPPPAAGLLLNSRLLTARQTLTPSAASVAQFHINARVTSRVVIVWNQTLELSRSRLITCSFQPLVIASLIRFTVITVCTRMRTEQGELLATISLNSNLDSKPFCLDSPPIWYHFYCFFSCCSILIIREVVRGYY